MRAYTVVLWVLIGAGCKKGSDASPSPSPAGPFTITDARLEGRSLSTTLYDAPRQPVLRLRFTAPVDRSSVSALQIATSGSNVPLTPAFSNGDSVVEIRTGTPLQWLTSYTLRAATGLKSAAGVALGSQQTFSFQTGLDSSDKFPVIADTALVEQTQQQAFRYFYDFGHPVSGLARERNSSGDVVTSGGSGFGIMALIVGAQRGFISRAQALQRLQTMVGFLKNTAQTYHGAYPHWLNGATGATVPFSANDNGADLVETSYLVQGLLCARQYFNAADPAEAGLRTDINGIVNGVEWDWFRKGGEQVLYWHWSPTVGWAMNMPIRGWNECLITYVLAASSSTHGIPASVYHNGWAGNGSIRNGNTYYGVQLPLGPAFGGPLFFSHYSFLGLDPRGLSDTYANYQTQVTAHARINYLHAIANPNGFWGYSDRSWGLTASDVPGGYAASSPSNDQGVIAPTAALSSFPYTPTESMRALKFFYYTLGDRLWGAYGPRDAYRLQNPWFADSYLAIDQGPIVVMMENYRSGLLWNLFTSCPEVKNGLRTLGFTAPYL